MSIYSRRRLGLTFLALTLAAGFQARRANAQQECPGCEAPPNPFPVPPPQPPQPPQPAPDPGPGPVIPPAPPYPAPQPPPEPPVAEPDPQD